MDYLDMEELPAGVHLIHQGDSPGAMYFLEDGMVTAQLEISGEEPRRLNTMQSENLVGEIGFYLGSKRNASVITETPTTQMVLNNGNFAALNYTSPLGDFVSINLSFASGTDLLGHWDATTFTVVPVPAAVWLFGSGLLGLVGVARRKSA